MTVLLVIFYVLVCVFLILVVLLQQGKGADLAGAFGGAQEPLIDGQVRRGEAAEDDLLDTGCVAQCRAHAVERDPDRLVDRWGLEPAGFDAACRALDGRPIDLGDAAEVRGHLGQRNLDFHLFAVAEDFELDLVIGEGPAARTVRIELQPFTLVGATTRAGLLTSPLRDRFGIVQRLEFYSTDDLTHIVQRSATILKVDIDREGAREIARRSRGTPRIANRLLRRVRDFAEVKSDGSVDTAVADAALNMLNVDASGFDHMDRRLLQAIIEKFDGGPVGVDSLAAAIGEERGTIEDVLEPYLIQQGFLMRTPRGRMATSTAWLHFGLEPPARPERPQDRDLFDETS